MIHKWQEYNEHGNTCHYPGCRLTEDAHRPVEEEEPEPFDQWARRQIEKLAANLREIERRIEAAHAADMPTGRKQDLTSKMPSEFFDPVVRAHLRVYTFRHGGGTGDAGLQITLDAEQRIDNVVCVRLPGPAAEEWLTAALAGLRQARQGARAEPWEPS